MTRARDLPVWHGRVWGWNGILAVQRGPYISRVGSAYRRKGGVPGLMMRGIAVALV